ncbi:MAG: hypothetical protein ABJL99_14520 [Aliishimia sp.]
MATRFITLINDGDLVLSISVTGYRNRLAALWGIYTSVIFCRHTNTDMCHHDFCNPQLEGTCQA